MDVGFDRSFIQLVYGNKYEKVKNEKQNPTEKASLERREKGRKV